MTAEEEPTDGVARRREARRKAWRFGRIVSGVLVALFAAAAAAARFDVFGAGFHVNFALALGVVGTTLLGVGLMALSFYSDRSGVDDGVIGIGRDEWSDDNRAP